MKENLPSEVEGSKNGLLKKTGEAFSKRFSFEQLVAEFGSKSPLTNLPAENKLIILVDIVGFSKSDSRTMVKNISFFQKFLQGFVLSNRFKFGEKIRVCDFIPTGDGCYIIADECESETAVNFLVTMISGFEKITSSADMPLAIRAGALFGECIPFIDLSYRKNFIGVGMNEASRILSGGQKYLEEKYMAENHSLDQARKFSGNSLFLGDNLKDSVENFRSKAENFFYLKDVTDKHGFKRNVTVLQGIGEMELNGENE
ncbi:MAG: hypothetical protein K5839_03330 [Treponemataceae bacterium]|nr:hypothetical protein [Treponemataceae bacterium]